MSKLLLDEKPLIILPELAKNIGLNRAIILQQIHYWIVANEKNEKNSHDGFTWCFNTYRNWKEQFPFWSEATIKRTIKSLEQKGLLVTENYNKTAFNKTKWYRIDYKKLKNVTRRRGQIDPTQKRSDCTDDEVKLTRRENSANTVPVCKKHNENVSQRLTTETTTKTTKKDLSFNSEIKRDAEAQKIDETTPYLIENSPHAARAADSKKSERPYDIHQDVAQHVTLNLHKHEATSVNSDVVQRDTNKNKERRIKKEEELINIGKRFRAKKLSKKPRSIKNSPDYSTTDRLIDYLNKISDSRFRYSKASRQPITARLNEGATEDDIKLVIDHKCALWLGDPEWEQYLNPETLCRSTKFERNLNAAIKWSKNGRPTLNEKARRKANNEAIRRWVEEDGDGQQKSDSRVERMV